MSKILKLPDVMERCALSRSSIYAYIQSNKFPKPIRLGERAVSELISGNVDNLQTWLDYVAKDNPVKAFDLLIKMMEFVIPKLSRTEYKDPARESDAQQINVQIIGHKSNLKE